MVFHTLAIEPTQVLGSEKKSHPKRVAFNLGGSGRMAGDKKIKLLKRLKKKMGFLRVF